MRARANSPVAVLLLVLLLVGPATRMSGLGADQAEKALAELEVSTELRRAQLEQKRRRDSFRRRYSSHPALPLEKRIPSPFLLHLEMARLCDPALAVAQAVILITDWGNEADDPEPAISALQTIASAAKGTPLRRLALFHLAGLMAEKERQEEAVQILTTLAVEAAGEAREGSRQAREKEERRLQEWEAELTARSQRLAEQSERLKEYAKQIKAEQARLERAERSEPKHHPEAEHPREAPQPHSEDR